MWSLRTLVISDLFCVGVQIATKCQNISIGDYMAEALSLLYKLSKRCDLTLSSYIAN